MIKRPIDQPGERVSVLDRYILDRAALEPVDPVKKPNKLKQLFSRKKKNSTSTVDNIGPEQRQFDEGRYLQEEDEGFGSTSGQRSCSPTNPIANRYPAPVAHQPRREPESVQPNSFSQPPRRRAVHETYSPERSAYPPKQATRPPSPNPVTTAARVAYAVPSERTESTRSSYAVAPTHTPEVIFIQPPKAHSPSPSPPPVPLPRSSSSQSSHSSLFDRAGSITPPTSVSSGEHKLESRSVPRQYSAPLSHGHEERPVARQPSSSSSIRTVPRSEDLRHGDARVPKGMPTGSFQTPDPVPVFTSAYAAPVVASDSIPVRAPLPTVPSPMPTQMRFKGGVGYETRAQVTVTTLEGSNAGGIHAKHHVSNHLAWAQDILDKNAKLRENMAQYSRRRGLDNLGTQTTSGWS